MVEGHDGRYLLGARGVARRRWGVRHRVARGRVLGIEDGLELQSHGVGDARRVWQLSAGGAIEARGTAGKTGTQGAGGTRDNTHACSERWTNYLSREPPEPPSAV